MKLSIIENIVDSVILGVASYLFTQKIGWELAVGVCLCVLVLKPKYEGEIQNA